MNLVYMAEIIQWQHSPNSAIVIIINKLPGNYLLSLYRIVKDIKIIAHKPEIGPIVKYV